MAISAMRLYILAPPKVEDRDQEHDKDQGYEVGLDDGKNLVKQVFGVFDAG